MSDSSHRVTIGRIYLPLWPASEIPTKRWMDYGPRPEVDHHVRDTGYRVSNAILGLARVLSCVDLHTSAKRLDSRLDQCIFTVKTRDPGEAPPSNCPAKLSVSHQLSLVSHVSLSLAANISDL